MVFLVLVYVRRKKYSTAHRKKISYIVRGIKTFREKNVETFGASARGNDLNFSDILFWKYFMYFFPKLRIHKEPTNTKIMPADFKLISPKHVELRATATWHEGKNN